MEYILEDCQLVLTNSINASRIIRVISPTKEFGKVLYKQKKDEYLSENSKRIITSANIIFKQRLCEALVCKVDFEEVFQQTTPDGVHEYRNVM